MRLDIWHFHKIQRMTRNPKLSQPCPRFPHPVHNRNHERAIFLRFVYRQIPAFNQNARGQAEFRPGRANKRTVSSKLHFVHQTLEQKVGSSGIVTRNSRPNFKQIILRPRSQREFTHDCRLLL